MRPTLSHRGLVLAAAVAPVLMAIPHARGGGMFDGGQVAATRLWDVGGANPGINWDFDTLPAAADPIVFDTSGDGAVDMNGLMRSHPGLTFKDWVSYTLSSGTFGLGTFGGGTLAVGASVSDTYGSSYFADGTQLTAGLDLGGAAAVNAILFTHPDTGALRLTGALTGSGSLSLSRTPGGSNIRGVYYDSANGGYSGAVTINAGVAARLLGPGRTGTGSITLNLGGGLDILSDVGAQIVSQSISVSSGTISADHNYTAFPSPPFAPGVLHVLGTPALPMTLDNPSSLGGTNDASVTFTANNGYNLGLYALKVGNAGLVPVGTRTVAVANGLRTTGFAGSVRQTSNNRQHEQVVTSFVGPPGGVSPSLFDIDPVTLAGITLVKTGTGVLAIEGPNETTSKGAKIVKAGVMRFGTGVSYGTTTGTLGGPPVTVTLTGTPPIPGTPVSAAMGVGYATPIPTNLTTTGGIPGQSGAFDVDTASAAPFAPAIVNTSAAVTALRLGSSGTGSITGGITPYGPTTTYYLGGGGGTLTIAGAPLGSGGAATVEMGTSGTLLPGRVNVTVPVTIGGFMVKIRAGTFQAMPAGFLGGGPGVTGGTSLGAYSTTLGPDGSYGGAPATTPFNAPGQLLLDATVQAGPGYAYGPGAHFGAAGLLLDGGALGYTPGGAPPPFAPLLAVPGTYGTTLSSTLYQSLVAPLAPVATNILHFGGEYSTTTIKPFFAITDNGATPVALLKSGVDSALDLTGVAANFYTGGTGILGGEVMVNMPGQLGPAGSGAVVIADGGILHVTGGGPPMVAFPQVLRAANGSSARSGQISVDAGVVAAFSTSTLESAAAGSVIEKTGGGILQILPSFVYPSTPANAWGIKATAGTVFMNQMPNSVTSANGSAIFDGGTLDQVGTADPGYIPIPAPTQYGPTYGYSGLQTYATTINSLVVGSKGFFRVTGAQTSSLMGMLSVPMGPLAVVKIAGDAAGDDTRGTGTVGFSGDGFVQFTPGGGNLLWPHDGGFTMKLDFSAQFSGCPDANFNGNLLFNTLGGSPMAVIDAATVDNAPTAAASTWTIGGTGTTAWNSVVMKGQTEAIPGSGGPFVSGTVNLNRAQGAPVSMSAGALLDIEHGIFNAGGTGDPFTDTSTFVHLPIVNNATFNITAGAKHVSSISGAGATTVFAGAKLDVGSSGPVTQSSFTVNGSADVGDVNVSGTTAVGVSPAFLTANYVRGGPLSIMTGDVLIKDNSGPGGVSHITSLAIGVGGHLDLRDNKLITTSAVGTWTGAAYTAVSGLIASGRNGTALPLWDGSGIITSQTNATTGNYTSIGIASGAQVKGIAATATAVWAGQTVSGSETLAMYTYGGDANLDGKINVDDYTRIDFNVPLGTSGWYNGDFNYDGKINVDDYTIIDFNVGIQGAPFSTAGGIGGADIAGTQRVTGLLGATAVPEPGGLGLLCVAALGGRRRRGGRRQRAVRSDLSISA